MILSFIHNEGPFLVKLSQTRYKSLGKVYRHLLCRFLSLLAFSTICCECYSLSKWHELQNSSCEDERSNISFLAKFRLNMQYPYTRDFPKRRESNSENWDQVCVWILSAWNLCHCVIVFYCLEKIYFLESCTMLPTNTLLVSSNFGIHFTFWYSIDEEGGVPPHEEQCFGLFHQRNWHMRRL